MPNGSRLVLAGRDEPPLRVARLRAEGRILEIGPADLSLTCTEAASPLRGVGLELGADEVAELHRRTEGWPTGLYLAALYLREGGSLPGAAVSFGGDDRLVSQYIESELLARISRRQRVFLTRTAVLERMSGSLCEAVLEVPGSAATLAELARSNLLLVPVDRRGQWYRYHHLFRDMLLGELRRQGPGLIPVLHRRAAEWRRVLPNSAQCPRGNQHTRNCRGRAGRTVAAGDGARGLEPRPDPCRRSRRCASGSPVSSAGLSVRR